MRWLLGNVDWSLGNNRIHCSSGASRHAWLVRCRIGDRIREAFSSLRGAGTFGGLIKWVALFGVLRVKSMGPAGRERHCHWKIRVRLVECYVDHYNNVRLNRAIGYITKDMLAGRQQEIHAERDRKLEAARKEWQIRRQKAA
jgi:hypothetical protein